MKNRPKYIISPPDDEMEFQELFDMIVILGAGRPLGRDGGAISAWTPYLLTEAISNLEGNLRGVDLRAVQLWFQDNGKGIGHKNIGWLSIIVGCGDPIVTAEWRLKLSTTHRKMKNNDQLKRQDAIKQKSQSGTPNPETKKTVVKAKKTQGFCLAIWTEALFSRSSLDLPATIFAGAVGLGISSYILGIHDLTISNSDKILKQLGFIWAPNWTLLFVFFMPLFFAVINELLVFWKEEGRLKFLDEADQAGSDGSWPQRVESSSLTYWTAFVLCVGFAGIFQWVGIRFLPLTSGGTRFAIDWGTLALVSPDIISVTQALVFTGVAYLYMCLCFYLFFAGLIILYTMVNDVWVIGSHSEVISKSEADGIGLRVLRGVYRCTILGILVAICMKAQSFYVTSSATNIVDWLSRDIRSVSNISDGFEMAKHVRSPTHYTSLIVALVSCIPFLYGSIRIGIGSSFQRHWVTMVFAVLLFGISYMLIGAFSGFSILLSVGLLVAMYGLFDPSYGRGLENKEGDNQGVS